MSSVAFVSSAPATLAVRAAPSTAVGSCCSTPRVSGEPTLTASSSIFAANTARRQFFLGTRIQQRVTTASFRTTPAFRIVAESVTEVTDATFDAEVLSGEGPVLLDFYRNLCGPCRLVAPLIDWAAGEYSGSIKVVKVEADENPESLKKFDVGGLPAILVVQDGKVLASHSGVLNKAQLRSLVQSAITPA